MRCPQCNHTQSKKEGNDCQKCGYRFVLIPKTDPIHDYKLTQLVKQLSVNEQYPFTRAQLVWEIVRFLNKRRLMPWGCLIILGGLASGVALTALFHLANNAGHSFFWGILSVVLGIFAYSHIRKRINGNALNKQDYITAKKLVQRYQEQHEIKGLVEGKAFASQEDTVPLDLAGIAPEAILVLERDDWVDALVLGRFHMQHKVAVVSRTGYPRQMFAALPGFVQAHPSISVLVLHDASRASVLHAKKLAGDPRWAFAATHLRYLGLTEESFTDVSAPLCWLNAKDELTISREPLKEYQAGKRFPLDFFRPLQLQSLMATALVSSGVLLLSSLLVSSTAEAGISVDVSGDFG